MTQFDDFKLSLSYTYFEAFLSLGLHKWDVVKNSQHQFFFLLVFDLTKNVVCKNMILTQFLNFSLPQPLKMKLVTQ